MKRPAAQWHGAKRPIPYRILVSEIMLQQTQVERVSVKFPVFIAAFPDFGSLARAPLADSPQGLAGNGI